VPPALLFATLPGYDLRKPFLIILPLVIVGSLLLKFVYMMSNLKRYFKLLIVEESRSSMPRLTTACTRPQKRKVFSTMSTNSDTRQTFKIDTQQGFYPIVYVRGFAATAGEREETFYDTYYGFAATAVEKRNTTKKDNFLYPIVFEGQLIRLLKEYGYVDAANGGLKLALSNSSGAMQDPTRSLWISRFYDRDVMSEKVRPIEEHAEELRRLICEEIPNQFSKLEGVKVDLGENNQDYKVILIAHSMGGLVCRCLIQNLLPNYKDGSASDKDPKRWIHRFVTIGTPHNGIELSAIPDFLEELIMSKGNVVNAAIFKEERMREYLKLGKKGAKGANPDLHSLNRKFPEGRCLCIIGSDHDSYMAAKKMTGNHSDGLVKQSNAYIKGAYGANVHRAHSGRRGIVNSFETYENIRRFLFGDTRVKLWLENVTLLSSRPTENIKDFYDIEFSLSVRGTGVFLHQRKQNPCENAMRFDGDEFPLAKVHLHTGFMDTKLRPLDEKFSHFLLAFRVAQHRVQEGFFFDNQYPERTIYSESLEVRVNLTTAHGASTPTVEYRWLSETGNPDDPDSWQQQTPDAGVFRFPFRESKTLSGELCIGAGPWPDSTTETVGIDAALA
jgi:hypothetical protein